MKELPFLHLMRFMRRVFVRGANRLDDTVENAPTRSANAGEMRGQKGDGLDWRKEGLTVQYQPHHKFALPPYATSK